MNNDVKVINPEWLEEMVSQAMQPGIGAVGPRLLYPDGRIQQAGVILGAGLHGVAEVAHRGLPKGDQGYFGRAVLAQELSAVGAACMLVRRSAYLEVGGFDEENLKIAFNDIDFCLKLLERGARILYTPYSRAISSRTRQPWFGVHCSQRATLHPRDRVHEGEVEGNAPDGSELQSKPVARSRTFRASLSPRE